MSIFAEIAIITAIPPLVVSAACLLVALLNGSGGQ